MAPTTAPDGAGARVGANRRHRWLRLLEQPAVAATGRLAGVARGDLVLPRLVPFRLAAGTWRARPGLEGRLYRRYPAGRASLGAAGPAGPAAAPHPGAVCAYLAARTACAAHRRGANRHVRHALADLYAGMA